MQINPNPSGSRTLTKGDEKPLPNLRKDVKIQRGPDDVDGSPTYSIYDPIQVQYYKISWIEALIFESLRPGMNVFELLKVVNKKSTVQLTKEELQAFFEDAERNNLLDTKYTTELIKQQSDTLDIGWLKWLMYHYLYIRIPIVNPDAFLAKTLHYVKPLLSKFAISIYAVLIIWGLLLLVNHWSEYIHTFTYFFTVEGFFAYAFAIIVVKIIHELAHGYVAKYYGVNVPTMGLAFIVLWPVLYTDVTDSWKLTKRSQRLAISAAGIFVESVLAGICTLGWAYSEPGILQSLFFVISSTSWISTIIVNVNPAMRFDGYYILCDLWGIDNLQTRAFAITRWQMRKTLLGLNLPPPEEVTTKRKTGMMIYTFYTWLYRLTIYIAIAAFIYFEFTKVLGIILLIVEIAVFMLWPLLDEIQEVMKLKAHITINKRLIITTIVVTLLLLWLILPLPHTLYFPSLVDSRNTQIVYAPQNALVDKIYVKLGDHVKTKQPLIKFKSFELDTLIRIREGERAIASQEIFLAQNDEKSRPLVKMKKNELSTIETQLKGLRALLNQMEVKSVLDGEVFQWDEGLYIGQAVAKDKDIGKIADMNDLEILFFVPQHRIEDIVLGQNGTFKTEEGVNLQGTIFEIHPINSKILEYPQLASIHAGPIPVTEERNGKLRILESYYIARLKIQLDAKKAEIYSKLRIGEIGTVEIEGAPHSKLGDAWRYFERIILRESGF